MKSSRKDEIIACCEGIIRNADKIVADYGLDRSLKITISIEPNAVPAVSVTKEFIPEEMWRRKHGGDVV